MGVAPRNRVVPRPQLAPVPGRPVTAHKTELPPVAGIDISVLRAHHVLHIHTLQSINDPTTLTLTSSFPLDTVVFNHVHELWRKRTRTCRGIGDSSNL